jgi:hypothetical protein
MLTCIVTFIILCSCTTIKTITQYSFKPVLILSEVERPENAKKQYGELKIESVQRDTSAVTKSNFADSLVSIKWGFGEKDISFTLENKTNHTILIKWNNSAIVDLNGESQRIIHSGIKYSEMNNSLPPTVVVRKGKISDSLTPTNRIHYREGYYGHYISRSPEWVTLPLINPPKYYTIDELKEQATSLVGKTYQVLLPLEIEGVQNDYVFIFKIVGYKIVNRDTHILIDDFEGTSTPLD